MVDVATIEAQALRLDRKARGHLASVLLRSLDETGSELSPEEIEELWIAEAENRYEEWESDPSVGIPGDQAMREAREALKR